MGDLNNVLYYSQDVVMIVLFFSIVLFVFMIYVGICVVSIKNNLKELTDLEYKKYNERKPNNKDETVLKEGTNEN